MGPSAFRRPAAPGPTPLADGARAPRSDYDRSRAGRHGLTIHVEEGLLLVTQAGDPADHVLGPGESLRLEGRGLGAAWALEPARVTIVRGGSNPSTLAARLLAA